MSVWGPFGELKSVGALAAPWQYPLIIPNRVARSVSRSRMRAPISRGENRSWTSLASGRIRTIRRRFTAAPNWSRAGRRGEGVRQRRRFRLLRARRLQGTQAKRRDSSASSRSTASGGSSIRTGICSSRRSVNGCRWRNWRRRGARGAPRQWLIGTSGVRQAQPAAARCLGHEHRRTGPANIVMNPLGETRRRRSRRWPTSMPGSFARRHRPGRPARSAPREGRPARDRLFHRQ